MRASSKRFPMLILSSFIAMNVCVQGGILYSTGFETTAVSGGEIWTVGDDKIVTFNNWEGASTTTYGPGRSGIDSETGIGSPPKNAHGVPGLGNAGFLGGVNNSSSPTISTSASLAPSLRRRIILPSPSFYDPVANNKEIVTFSTLIGIKDSTPATFGPTLRDKFEVTILNGNAPVPDVLAAIRFDNSTLDTQNNPQQLMLRTVSTAGTTALTYVSNDLLEAPAYFVYDAMQLLTVRINWRTNKWSAYLDGIPLFNDKVFYIGSATRNLGFVGYRMNFGRINQTPIPFTFPTQYNYSYYSGDNYALFDDLSVQADVLPAVTVLAASKPSASSFSLTWNAEAAYRYNVYGSTTMQGSWSLLTPTALTASLTTSFSYSDMTTSGIPRKFYKVARIYP